MSMSRYVTDPRIDLGQQLGTSYAVARIRSSIKSGLIPIVNSMVLTGDDRLDSLAGSIYGDARYWWVLAAASNIGWGMQVPAGTLLNVINLDDVQKVIG